MSNTKQNENYNPYLLNLLNQNYLVNRSLKFASDNVEKIIDNIEELEYLNENYVIPDFASKMEQLLKNLDAGLNKLSLEISEINKWEKKLEEFKD